MKIEKILPGEIYLNSRGHIVLLNGKHIAYIDILNDAIVYVTMESLKAEDWERYVPEQAFTETEFETPKKGRGRPRKEEVNY
jgi:hypothetical protein